MIIIFDLHGVIPCYSPCMEQFEDTMLGSIGLRGNMFREMCGSIVGPDGETFLDLSVVPDVILDAGPSTGVNSKRPIYTNSNDEYHWN